MAAIFIPGVLSDYHLYNHPHVVQWVMPISHVCIMTSVYCTMLIRFAQSLVTFDCRLLCIRFAFSFERYVRICFLCQLRSTRLITKANFKYYVAVLIVWPLIFYTPKFFEVR